MAMRLVTLWGIAIPVDELVGDVVPSSWVRTRAMRR